jgi:Raf kinase inhibitor-like YbhB/YbcL family protein
VSARTLVRATAVFSLAVLVSAGALIASAAEFTLSSLAFNEGDTLSDEQAFDGSGCTGKNISPPLVWSNAPRHTRSFAVTVHDPDAPVAGGWWHWVIYDIPATAKALPAGAGTPETRKAPKGSVQGVSDFGRRGYGGPCPPAGDKPHRYVFRVYALDVPHLVFTKDASPAMIRDTLKQHALGTASVTALFGR